MNRVITYSAKYILFAKTTSSVPRVKIQETWIWKCRKRHGINISRFISLSLLRNIQVYTIIETNCPSTNCSFPKLSNGTRDKSRCRRNARRVKPCLAISPLIPLQALLTRQSRLWRTNPPPFPCLWHFTSIPTKPRQCSWVRFAKAGVARLLCMPGLLHLIRVLISDGHNWARIVAARRSPSGPACANSSTAITYARKRVCFHSRR